MAFEKNCGIAPNCAPKLRGYLVRGLQRDEALGHLVGVDAVALGRVGVVAQREQSVLLLEQLRREVARHAEHRVVRRHVRAAHRDRPRNLGARRHPDPLLDAAAVGDEARRRRVIGVARHRRRRRRAEGAVQRRRGRRPRRADRAAADAQRADPLLHARRGGGGAGPRRDALLDAAAVAHGSRDGRKLLARRVLVATPSRNRRTHQIAPMLSLLSAASGFNAPLSSRVAAPTRAAAPVMDNSWRSSFDGRGGVGATRFASRTVASPAHLGCRTTHRLWPPPQTAGAPLAHHRPLARRTDRSRAAIFARSQAARRAGSRSRWACRRRASIS